MENRDLGSRGFSFKPVLFHSLWTTLTGILFFSLATMNHHNFVYIKFFAASGTVLTTLPWIIQLLISSTVIFLHKTKGINLMWILRSPSKENTRTIVVSTCTTSSSSPLSSQVLKESDADKIEIRIIIDSDGKRRPEDASSAAPKIMEIEAKNDTKLLTNGSPNA